MTARLVVTVDTKSMDSAEAKIMVLAKRNEDFAKLMLAKINAGAEVYRVIGQPAMAKSGKSMAFRFETYAWVKHLMARFSRRRRRA